MQLGPNLKLVRLSNGVVAGTSEIDSTAVDRAGFEGVMFIVHFGVITTGSGVTAKAQSCTDSSGGGAADLTGASVAVPDTDDNKMAIIDVAEPTQRYLRCVVTRTTQNAVVDGVSYLGVRHIDMPTTPSRVWSAIDEATQNGEAR